MDKIFYQSPIGILKIETKNGLLYSIGLESKIGETRESSFGNDVVKQLDEYFKGKLKNFDIPVIFEGATEFQKEVYRKLLTVGYGKTKSYKELAEMIGSPNAARAVGTALGKNPIPIVVPCHRIILTAGKIGQFSLGGSHVKKFLLALEKENV